MLDQRWISLLCSFSLATLGLFPTTRVSAAPTLDVVAQIATHAVDLDWSESAPGTPVLYNIERALSPSGSWTALVDPADRDDTLRFTDAGIPIPNVTWYYRVAAEYDGVGPEIHSPVVAVTLDPDCEGYCVNHDGDRDDDGSLDADDNCVALPNDQTDTDGDGIGDACDSPADYTSFISVTAEDEADLIAKIQATPDVATHLYVPPRNYYFTSTIDIERTAPLIIHGAGRNQTKFVVPASGPLFRIRDAATNPSGTHIQFSNLRIQNSTAVEVMGISLETTLPGHLDLNEVHLENVGLAILGPGFTRLQATNVASRNYTTQSILVDHPDADFFMIGGGLATGGGAPLSPIDRSEVSSFRQKAGRIRAYTSSNAGARGIADYWFEAGSKFGAHMLGDIRSEGANAGSYNCTTPGDSEFLTGRLLYVGPTDERVDVVIKGALASWSYYRLLCPHTAGMWDLVSYSSPGRLWLTNNTGGRGYETLVTGSAKAAQITSVNNQSLLSVHSTVDVGGTGQLISVGDVGSFNFACQESNGHSGLNEPPCNQGPRARFYLPDGAGGYAANYDPTWDPSAPGAISPDRFENLTTAIVPFPKEDLPTPMARPVLTAPFADMASVTDFGAIGDGVSDDTAAIQAAFRESGSGTPSGARLYFPAGTYCVTSPLYWNHQQITDGEPYLSSSAMPGNVVPGNNQGWWAGAGSDLTKIIFDIGCDGTADTGNLFGSQKMVEMVIQGITFETAAWNGVDDTKTFWVENYHQQCTNTGIPTYLPDCATVPAPPHQPARSNYELPDPFTMGASHGSVFDDTVFIGGKHAHAVAIETHTNNSEILWMNSHFTDAFRGVTVNNANALNNIVYNGTFERNDEMIGPGGGGDFSVFGATVDGGICPSLLTGGSIYVYGLDDSGGTGCTSYIYAPGGSWNLMVGSLYENSTLAPSGAGAQVDRNRSGFFTLLHSEVISTMGVDLWNDYTTSESIVAIHSPHPVWDLDAPLDETSFESDFPLTVPEPRFASLLATGAAGLIQLSRLRRSRRRT